MVWYTHLLILNHSLWPGNLWRVAPVNLLTRYSRIFIKVDWLIDYCWTSSEQYFNYSLKTGLIVGNWRKKFSYKFCTQYCKMVQSECFMYLIQWFDWLFLKMSTKTYWKSFISEIQMIKYQEMSNIVIHRYITGIYFLQDNTWKENFVFYIKKCL